MDSLSNFSAIIGPAVLKKYVEFWINEDIPNFDLSTLVVKDEVITAKIDMKEKGIFAGLPFAEAVFKYFDCTVEWRITEGSFIAKPTVIGIVKGPANKILMAERTSLNILTRACGVATVANRLSSKLKVNWKGELTGSRKTTPGFRIVEKYAMYIGGISTHRYDLSSMVMVKDNHVKANGSIEKSIQLLRSKIGKLMKIEVECGNLNEALEAAKCGADVVMLDNFSSNDVRSVSKQVKNINPSVLIEASGGINENNIMDYAIDNVDIISSSLFSQGYKCIDLSINTIMNNASSTPDISESLKVTNSSAPQTENISADKIQIAPAIVSNTDSIDKEKIGIKRKLEEPTDIIVDKPKTNIVKVPEPTVDKVNSSKQSTVKNTPNNKTSNKYDSSANKQRKMNSNGKMNQTVYNLQTMGSVRMPGQPVRFETKGSNNSRSNIDNQANFIRTMAANLVLSLQNSQPNNAPFMNPNAMRFGGPIPRVPFMNNIKFCKSCNFQNHNPGNPFCQNCRKKLE